MRELINKLRKKSVGADASVRPFLREISKEGKGITLIALIITIVVMLILVSVTVTFTIGENGILSSAKEAKFKQEVAQIKEQYGMNLVAAKMDKNFKEEDLYANNELGNLKNWIPSIQEKYQNKLHIEAGILCANSAEITEQEAKWLNDLGIQANAVTATATTDLWQLDQTKTRIIKYIGKDGDGLVKTGETIIIPNRVYNLNTNDWCKITNIGDGQNLLFANNRTNQATNVKMIFSKGLIVENESFYNYGTRANSENLQIDELIIEDNVTFDMAYLHVNKKMTVKNNCIFKDVDIFGNVEKIIVGDNCKICGFSDVAKTNCKSITIGNNATIYSQFCTGNNENLQNVTIGESLTIESDRGLDRLFTTGQRTSDLNVYIKGIKYAGSKLVSYHGQKVNMIIEKIEDNAIIEDEAFYCAGYSNIDILDIGENVTIGEGAFNSTNISTSNLVIGKNATIGKSAFRTTGIKKLMIEEGVTIGEGAFANCNEIEEITIGNNITILDRIAFAYNASLKNVIIGNNVKLSENSFYDCTGIESLTIGDGSEIVDNTLNNCSGIKQVTLGDAIIPEAAFEDCTNIEKVTISEGAGANFTEGLFKGFTTIKTIELGKNITLPASIFSNTGIESLVINEGTNLGGSSFSQCSSLATVQIKSGTIIEGKSIFSNCKILTSVNMEEGVTALETSGTMFSNCSALQEITIPNSFGYMNTGMFVNCSSLKTLKISEGENIIRLAATVLNNGCTQVETVEIPSKAVLVYNSFNSATIGTIKINKTRTEVESEGLVPWKADTGVEVIYSDGEEVTY